MLLPGRFRKSILWFGRFSQNKRIDRLIDFMSSLTSGDPEWRLRIAGRPDDLRLEDVKGLVQEKGLEDVVEVVAYPSDEKLKSLMGDSSFVAAASDYEGFGMTPIEGMSAGLFPLLSDIPPFRRLIGRTGLGMRLDFANPDQAAATLLKKVSALAAGYAEQRFACMQAARAYDWECVSQEVAKLYIAASPTEPRKCLGAGADFQNLAETTLQGRASLGKR